MYNPLQIDYVVRQRQSEMEAYGRQQALLKEAREAAKPSPRPEKSKFVGFAFKTLAAAAHLLF